MSREKKKCIVLNCKGMGESLGRHGKAKKEPFYSNYCHAHRTGPKKQERLDWLKNKGTH